MFSVNRYTIINFSILLYSLLLEFHKNMDLDIFEDKRVTGSLSFYFLVKEDLIGVDQAPIFMHFNLIEIDEDFHLASIDQIIKAFKDKYEIVTDGKELSINDELIILNLKLRSEEIK